jgi:Icc-related predicted phosphoesterase
MRFLFLTDFHGNHKAYKRAFECAEAEQCEAIVNAGDALPKNFGPGEPFTAKQREWWQTWFVKRLSDLKDRGIKFYMMFGNDDARAAVHLLDEAEDEGLLVRIDRPDWVTMGDYSIIGMPWVPDYPFALKDWCCSDTERGQMAETQFGEPVVSGADSFRYLRREWLDELLDRPSLSERLAKIPVPADPKRAILFMHSPPSHGGLDVCADGRRVGSRAGLDHIADRQYLLAMHGHIHESPKVSGQWYARVGDTLCVQPGAVPPCHTIVDLSAMSLTHPYHGNVSIL